MPITYGSVGDIIATVQIAAQLLKALSASNGSAQEFQDLVIQLRTFHRILDQVSIKLAMLLLLNTDAFPVCEFLVT